MLGALRWGWITSGRYKNRYKAPRMTEQQEPSEGASPRGVVQLLAQCAVQIRNTPNISNDGLLWQLDRARVFLNWIDECGGWTDELRSEFSKLMQFYD
jgi:hypothetical protein